MTVTRHTAERIRLGELLAKAARTEQGVMCQYLFAAFSMKKTVEEGGVDYGQLAKMRVWEAQIMRVARQEMEHLGLVQNLRTAIGEAPSLDMPALPFEETIEGETLRFTLEKFDEPALTRFALAEMPENLPPGSPAYCFLADRIDGFAPVDFDAIARLYDRIRELFSTLPEADLFVGPPGAQFNTHDIFPGVIRGLKLSSKAAYQFDMHKVTDRASALAAIDQIAEEGEGARLEGGEDDAHEDSHFAVFMEALVGVVGEREKAARKGALFAPARDVLENPTLDPGGGGHVSDPFARDALALYEACHRTMMMMLTRFFSCPDDHAEMAALQQAVFFPMMTTIIRPLGEVLTLLPAATGGTARAGANFAPAGDVELSPHKESAFGVLEMRYADMERMAKDLLDRFHRAPPDAPAAVLEERLTHIHQQIGRSHLNLKVNYARRPDVI